MKFLFDLAKNAKNLANHGIAFDAIDELQWDTSITVPDLRWDYGEPRFVTYAMRNGKLHCLVWTNRNGALRPISLRIASRSERRDYENEKRA